MEKFSIEGFVQGRRQAVKGVEDRLQATKEFMARTLAAHEPAEIIAVLEAAVPPGAGVGEMIVYRDGNLTMMYARIPGRFRSGIHNHTVCACMGQLSGEERSVLYERDDDGTVRATETVTVKAGEVMALRGDAIHHIENPCDDVSASLHLYAGDLPALAPRRSLWSSDERREGAFSFEGLVEQGARAMKAEDNAHGLAELVKAIPALKPLVDSL